MPQETDVQQPWKCSECLKGEDSSRPTKKIKHTRNGSKGDKKRTRRGGGKDFSHPNVSFRYIAPICKIDSNREARKKMSFSNILAIEGSRDQTSEEPIDEPQPANLNENDIIISEDFVLAEENDVPPHSDDLEAKPIPQKPRFKGDLYTPRWIRGVGKQKEGLCPLCKPGPVWCKIKISAFW
jgi:hypothetical protein